MITFSDPPAMRRWRVQRLLTGLPLLVLVVVNTARLGAVDHMWPIAIGINLAAVASIPIVVTALKRRDARAMELAPPDTLFIGGFNLQVSQLQQRRFARSAQAVGNGRWGTGWVSGRMTLSADRIELEAKPRLLDDSDRINASDLAAVSLTKVPAKINVGGLDLKFADGTTLAIQVTGYDRIRASLARFGAQRASSAA